MPAQPDIDVLVFDLLGTLVDEPGGIKAAIAEAAPDADVDDMAEAWAGHVARLQRQIVDGERPYASSEAIDREAAGLVAAECGVTDAAAIDRLATAGRRLDPWPDTVASLDRLAARFPIVGLSNASRATLPRLSAHAGLRWHFLLSAEDVQTYKPAPDVYRLALLLAGTAASRVLMVAAHAWDLRGAQAMGLSTAYVRRPIGDAPLAGDAFDFEAESLAGLADVLLDR
ncbi:haloacid dehalogenase type II [Glycomyces sp. TRM65418]|uniref:haloacid dehalogenase type II n=1 Tax=Glycomyces sp. TRM65418 TaxID=2867006 RepID=UPI001CE6F77A|nr:haloacid dehalogenase type II [Glycomyces sp. TRM65418]MCC3763464.1 haloacid dehalogenase type II [Glycomyces sp. TRM65418]QZD57452.1 haloacid dehalogenase type II [Glycomyces sp. TRM65418]